MLLMGGRHWGCPLCSLCDPKGTWDHFLLPAGSPGFPELRPASNKEEHTPCSRELPAGFDPPGRCPCPRALFPSWLSLVAPRAVCHCCSPGTAPPCPPPLPSSAPSPPSPCLVTSSAAPGPQEQNKELPAPQVGREGNRRRGHCSPSGQRSLASAALALQTPHSSSSSGVCLKSWV